MSLLQILSDNKPTEEQDEYIRERKGDFLLDELKMLFSSHSCFSFIEEIPLVNSSVLNYGIDESMIRTNVHKHQNEVIEEYIAKTILRFEPRLLDVVVNTKKSIMSGISFEISALHEDSPIKIELNWDIECGRFYFNE